MKVIKNKEINHRPKVSVLISTYNKEKFINKTLDSILKQSMDVKDFELIVVDDCSTDQTVDIVSKKIDSFSNYKFIQLNQNSGTPAKPRNLSIDLSKGKYIMFIDGDDWLPEDALEKLYTLLKTNKTDYATGLTKYVYSNRIARSGVALSKIAYNKADLKNFRKSFYHLAPAGRMIKASVIKKNHIQFPEMIFGEDLQFFAEVFFNTKRISTTQDVVYCANRYDDNISLVKSEKSTHINRMKWQGEAYRHLMSKYKNNKLMPNLLYRIINKDVLEAKFYKKGFIKNINELLPIFQNIIHMVDEHFDALDYADDDLNRQAIKLIREGNKEDIISFVKFYLKKDDKPLHEKNDIYYYSFKGTHYKKRMHPTLLNISQENDKVFLKILSKNSELKYLEIKHRKDPTQFIVLDIKKHRFKSGEYTVQFTTKNLPDGKLALTVLDKDLNGSVIKSGMRFDFYETVGGNLGYIKK
ncbi:glycosyltransferase involved in cell wall biosynthesis [Staphylococcus hominis]|uniref:glycosyltransferase family 2 protein n=1 Tax=Staphylococcus hominis TaxID=1290 RepID=UPI00160B1F4D|nr:glycosyltransferase family 2 protein [Staphylococcus hominis]MBB4833524.1 glycosyltransferase involved in cell wall biosynthesis [Staphylococcus hominis]MCI2871147.1 glycosyltransferase [Staphylococcus hominis]MCI2875394.1 glycosyltransferase [Staphylococcus hominis]MCI2890340.1 glycosyltransferase [Staphylococcus hominis]